MLSHRLWRWSNNMYMTWYTQTYCTLTSPLAKNAIGCVSDYSNELLESVIQHTFEQLVEHPFLYIVPT